MFFRSSTVSPSPDRPAHSRQPSSGREDGYPSWLPRRPGPPVPRSTMHSSVAPYDAHEPDDAAQDPRAHLGHGRRATQRSVRIVSLPDTEKGAESRREPTDTTRVGPTPSHARVYSRGTAPALSPTMLATAPLLAAPRPRFNEPNLHIELLRNPSTLMHVVFWLNRFLAFAHIPLQTFFDFNALFALFQVAKFPTPIAPGVPGSGRGWAFAFAAYLACYLLWIFIVVILFEVLYSFYRRWRTKRPYMLSIYLSSPAYTLASMASYNHFSFLWHIRLSAVTGDDANLRDAAAETCYFYAQNWPTVVLLLPRAALCLALLLVYSAPSAQAIVLASAGTALRDGTFFRENGSLTSYARGVLIANAAWTAWRTLLVIGSIFGLWALSGMACAGLCGPRFRWEEDRNEKWVATDAPEDEADAIPWSWRECTRLRIQDAHDFCLTTRPSLDHRKKRTDEDEEPFEGLDRVLAAVGFPREPPPARRPMLAHDLFAVPPGPVDQLSSIIPPVDVERKAPEDNLHSPLKALPYPFSQYPAATGSAGPSVPFPTPIQTGKKPHEDTTEENGTEDVDDDEDGEEEVDEDEEGEEDDDLEELEDIEDEYEGEERSPAERTSGSMSSLGQPLPMAHARYPFQYGRPSRSASGGTRTNTPRSRPSHSGTSNSGSGSHPSQRISSESPRSNDLSSSTNSRGSRGSRGIPMPPRHPNPRSRTRASSQLLPEDLDSSRLRTISAAPSMQSVTGGEPTPERIYESSEVDIPFDGSEDHHEVETDDVQLLSPGEAPLRNRRSTVSSRSRGSRTNSQSSGVGASMASLASEVRSRTRSLVQSAPRSVSELGELVRGAARSRSQSRTGSGYTRSSPAVSSSSRSGGSSSVGQGPEHTFGVQSRWTSGGGGSAAASSAALPLPTVPSIRSSPSAPSISSVAQSMATARQEPLNVPSEQPSIPDISSADPSFVTVPEPGSSVTTSDSSTWGVGRGHMGGHQRDPTAGGQFDHPAHDAHWGQH
ncbi:hypothetical protein EXIGLDRAFT_763136 [Exidia glandulosa HHB12029]|uniref:Proteophosphoglycan ppg4 n=1 Tax=Exidia glandulosa HHB12029 TaxID=1314781 RepID=A0A165M8F4_EXIGL|nr:hypothetical protein EXIGLDRAFT_763136 [Exidia glandulosa HHB12029]